MRRTVKHFIALCTTKSRMDLQTLEPQIRGTIFSKLDRIRFTMYRNHQFTAEKKVTLMETSMHIRNFGNITWSSWWSTHVLPVDDVIPPSTTSSCPVMYRASSLTRNNVALATSQASPIFPKGTCAFRIFIYSSA